MASHFVTPYSIMEKIQVTAFCIQEFIISGLYLYETRRLLQPGAAFQKKRARRVMIHLIIVNIVIILMDITLLCTEYANLYEIQITFKGTLYSIKLRLEFAVLNSLMSLTARGNSSGELPNTVYSHSAGGGVGLETLHAPPPADGPSADGAPNGYSVFAARSQGSPFSTRVGHNVVVKTTEVAVRTEPIEPDAEEKHGSENIATHRRPRPAPSPASSEVGFAGAGY